MIFKLLFVIVIAFMMSCGGDERVLPSYGLSVVNIELSSEDQAKLVNNTWKKIKVSARVNVGEKEFLTFLRYAGATSIDSFKRSYQITLRRNESLKGHRAYRLSSQYKDVSFSRTVLGYEVYKMAGLLTSEIEPVVVYLNNDMLGLYLLIEPINERFFLRRDRPIASLFKSHYNNRDLEHMLPNLDDAFSAKVKPTFYGDLAGMVERVLKVEGSGSCEEFSQVINLDSFYRYVAASVILDNWDGYRNNVHLYRSKGFRNFSFVPWDLDAILPEREGIDLYGKGRLFAGILDCAPLRVAYHDKLRLLIDELDFDVLRDRLIKWGMRIDEAVAVDRVMQARETSVDREHEVILRQLKRRLASISASLDAEE